MFANGVVEVNKWGGQASEKMVEKIQLGMKTRKTLEFTCINSYDSPLHEE